MRLITQRGGIGEEVLITMVYKNIPDKVQSKIIILSRDECITWESIYYMAVTSDDTPRISRAAQDIYAFNSRKKIIQKYIHAIKLQNIASFIR